MHYSDIRRYITHTRAVRGKARDPLVAKFGGYALNPPVAWQPLQQPSGSVGLSGLVSDPDQFIFAVFGHLFRFGLIVDCFLGRQGALYRGMSNAAFITMFTLDADDGMFVNVHKWTHFSPLFRMGT